MQKILLYYKFTQLADPEAARLWQHTLCEQLNLKGRILISPKGINGTVGGDLEDLKAYTKATKQYTSFKGIEFKWSDGSRDDFPKLSVKVRDETVTFGLPDLNVDDKGIVDGGKRIKPSELDDFMAKNPNAVLFDGRNNYESAIGKFKDAVIPDVNHFRELPDELDKPEYEALKDKQIVTYCTGGIRCETLTALMKQKGFKDVYQLHGGIVKYGEAKKDSGLWQGKCFVFDRRMHVKFSDRSLDIGTCSQCAEKTSNYVNCAYMPCNNLVLICPNCNSTTETCSAVCSEKFVLSSERIT